MAFYDPLIDSLGLTSHCGAKTDGPMTMAQLLAKAKGVSEDQITDESLPFPSLDNLHAACSVIPQTRDLTQGLEEGFLSIKNSLKIVLDPLTEPLSWALDATLSLVHLSPWWITIPLLVLSVLWVSRSVTVSVLVATVFLFFAFIDHFDYAMETLAIIFVCTIICVVFGVPLGIAMSKSDRLQKWMIPILDMLQTLPTFVYLIPLIFLFSVTESKLYGLAIILYAIVPVVRLTDLGIRLLDPDILEAANAFGMSKSQKLIQVEIPLALPNIMAGINQTIMMSLAMVVIASLVSAPGLGTLVLRGIRNLELGVGLVAGLGIVLLAVVLDRASKAALNRINRVHRS